MSAASPAAGKRSFRNALLRASPAPAARTAMLKPASSRGRSYLTQLMSKGPSTVMKYVAPSSLVHASCTIFAGM
jgi:hypothetical protein